MGKRRILVLFAHPAIGKSLINARLLEAARSVDGVTVNDLYARYPDFMIDVAHEQQLLLTHDVIVFQHPLYWYSSPAILKEWQDLTLEHGFAYGREGQALQGKYLLSAITAGGAEASYRPEGRNSHVITEILSPFEQTAELCGMVWLPPFVTFGALTVSEAEIETAARKYAALLETLRDDTVPLRRAKDSALYVSATGAPAP